VVRGGFTWSIPFSGVSPGPGADATRLLGLVPGIVEVTEAFQDPRLCVGMVFVRAFMFQKTLVCRFSGFSAKKQ
jgi:hypothetical protein